MTRRVCATIAPMPAARPPVRDFDQALGLPVADKRLAILRAVGESGSISQAARDCGVSYKAAWQAVDTLTNLAGVPLVARAVGGAGGGGAQLTEAGQALLAAAGRLATVRRRVVAPAVPAEQPALDALDALARLGWVTSMRNLLPAQVLAVKRRGRMAEVRVAVAQPTPQPAPQPKPGHPSPMGAASAAADAVLQARITWDSAQLLDLRAGQTVLVLFKATAARVQAASVTTPATAGLNTLPGTVARVWRSVDGDEVVLTLTGGARVSGFAPPGLRLARGAAACLLLDPSALVLAPLPR